jgi:carboxylesterase
MSAPILSGAEPASFAGGPVGVLCAHGFTGNSSSMRPVAEALAAAGFTVELPLWPGHGTSVEDMLPTRWADWSGAAEAAYTNLAERCERVLVAGLSMGGTLTCWLAGRHPEIAGIVCVNPLVRPEPELLDMVRAMVAEGTETMPAIGSDIADPDAKEIAYEATPIAPLASLLEAVSELDLTAITCPVLLFTSPQDHVVDPGNSDYLVTQVRGPVERVLCERSFHVATQDYDRDLILERTIEFTRRVTAGGGE